MDEGHHCELGNNLICFRMIGDEELYLGIKGPGCNVKIKYCPNCGYSYQPERSKREDCYIGGYFPPPWNANEYPEKTEGWIAFQEAQRKDPKYYGCGALNSMET